MTDAGKFDNFGTGNGFRYRNIRCMVNGHRFYVRVRTECTQLRLTFGGGYGYGGGYAHGGGYAYSGGYHVNTGGGYYVTKKRKGRRVRVLVQAPVYAPAPVYQGGGYVDDGYGYVQPRVIRYYQPASRAAVMQQRKRAARAARAAAAAYGAYGYDNGGGYGYGAGIVVQGGGYGYGGGYATGGGYGYGDGTGYRVTKRGKKRLRRGGGMTVIQPTNIYNPGVVYQYGPVMTKDGGY
jgi:hypothetical protein